MGQKLLTWIRICYTVPWWPSWLSDWIAFSNSESDVVWRVSRLPPWSPSWILELNNSAILNLHVVPIPPIKFGSNWLTVWEVWFKEFQDGGHLGHWNRRISAILNFHNAQMPPIMFRLNRTYHSVADVIWKFSRWLPWWPSWISEQNYFSNTKSPCCPSSFGSIQLKVSEEISFKECQDGHHSSHLGYRNRTILAILNLSVAPMPAIKFWLNLTYDLGGDVVWRISRSWNWNGTILAILNLCVTVMPPIKFWLNRLVVWEGMPSEEFQDGCHGSLLRYRNGTILAISLPSSFGSIRLTVWEEMSFEEFQDGSRGGHLGYQNRKILSILNLCVTVMPPIKFWLNLTYSLVGDVVWRISKWPPWWPSWISEWKDFSNSESLCHCDASHQVSAQPDLRFGRRCRLKNFKMATMD